MDRMKRFLAIVVAVVIMMRLVPMAHASSLPFTDVPSYHDYYDAIKYVYDNGIMNGMTTTTFGPDVILNRAMLVTTLYRMSGSNEKIAPVGFTDVPSGSFFYYPVGWAQHYGIVNGFTATKFGPEVTLTNQQIVTFLYRYVTEYKGVGFNLPDQDAVEDLLDYEDILDFAREPTNWALNCGVVQNIDYRFLPNQEVSRECGANYLYLCATLAFGDAKVLCIPEFRNYWAGEWINTSLESRNYDSTIQYIYDPLPAQYALYNSEIVYICSHGLDGSLCFDSGNLYFYDFEEGSLDDCYLAYLGACYAGGTLAEELIEVAGARYVIGFTDEVLFDDWYYPTGVNYFDKKFFEYYEMGYSAEVAFNKAYQYFDDDELADYRIDSVRLLTRP